MVQLQARGITSAELMLHESCECVKGLPIFGGKPMLNPDHAGRHGKTEDFRPTPDGKVQWFDWYVYLFRHGTTH
jgi:hypothetical protein